MGNCIDLCNDHSSYNKEDIANLQFVPRLHDHNEIPLLYHEANKEWPTLLYFHPHDVDLGELDLVKWSLEFQCNVITFDYCGLGLHTQWGMTKEGLEEDCIAVFYYARTKLNIPQHQLRFMGLHFGNALACFLSHYLSQRRVFVPLVLLHPLPIESIQDYWWESIKFDLSQLAKDILSDTICVYYRNYKNLDEERHFESLTKQFPYLMESFVEPHEHANLSHRSIQHFLQLQRD